MTHDPTTQALLVHSPVSEFIQAARVIQRAWRRHVDTSVFKYLKKLLSFHNQGDPHLLLRYINPAEATILDAASGTLIRFRLGGVSYPPNIYFKIFTRAPVVDMCAFSPKDYTKVKQAVPFQIHNGRPLVCSPGDQAGWYQRVENNGWRILGCKMGMFEDPVTQETNIKKLDFHHCKIKRQQDVARKKKMRKIEWMRKMYADGLIKPSGTAQMLQNFPAGLEEPGADAVFEQEVDELLEWTTALDFEDYINDWRSLGSSRCCVVLEVADEQEKCWVL